MINSAVSKIKSGTPIPRPTPNPILPPVLKELPLDDAVCSSASGFVLLEAVLEIDEEAVNVVGARDGAEVVVGAERVMLKYGDVNPLGLDPV